MPRLIPLSLILVCGVTLFLVTRGRARDKVCPAKNDPGTLIFIGDSISATTSEPYGSALASAVTGDNRNAKVARYAVGGSNAKLWMNDQLSRTGRDNTNTACETRAGRTPPLNASELPDFREILKANLEAGGFVIALGTNDVAKFCVGLSHGESADRSRWILGASEMAKATTGKKCVWILPLAYEDGDLADSCRKVNLSFHEAAMRYLRPALAPCKVVDPSVEDESGPACPRPATQDGIHPLKDAPATALARCEGLRVRWWLRH